MRIVDRKKEIIINASGKNMSPSNIENAIKAATSLVGQVVAIGDDRSYVAAIAVLDPDAAAGFAAQHGIAGASQAELVAHPEMRAAVLAGVKEGNQKLASVEQVKRIRLLPVHLGAGRRRAHPDDEAAPQADRGEVRPRDRLAVRRHPRRGHPAAVSQGRSRQGR